MALKSWMVGAAKTMMERTEERFALTPEQLAADAANALQHPSRTSAKYRRTGVRREFDERIAMPNGRDAPIDFGSAAQCVLSCAGR